MFLVIIGETSHLPGRGEDPSEVHPGHQDHRQVTPGNPIQHLQLLPQEMELLLQIIFFINKLKNLSTFLLEFPVPQ